METVQQVRFLDMRASILDVGDFDGIKAGNSELTGKVDVLSKKAKKTEEEKELLVNLKKQLEASDRSLKEAEDAKALALARMYKTGMFKFKKKVYIDYTGVQAPLPEYKLKWCRYEPNNNYREFRKWQIAWGYTPVVPVDDYIPEGLPPDSTDYYVYGDLILVKIPLDAYLKKREQDIDRGDKAAKQKLRKYEEDSRRSGVGVSQHEVEQAQEAQQNI